MHQMNFGIAIGMSSRTIAVGAPLADYGNLGDTNVRETYNTNGLDNYGVGRGKVYIFHSAPHQQTVFLLLLLLLSSFYLFSIFLILLYLCATV
jgi:hypothetical protein